MVSNEYNRIITELILLWKRHNLANQNKTYHVTFQSIDNLRGMREGSGRGAEGAGVMMVGLSDKTRNKYSSYYIICSKFGFC